MSSLSKINFIEGPRVQSSKSLDLGAEAFRFSTTASSGHPSHHAPSSSSLSARMEKRTVPSFSSFKPRLSATPAATQAHSDPNHSSSKREGERLERHDEKRHRSHDHRRSDRERHRDRHGKHAGRHSDLEVLPHHRRHDERGKRPITPPGALDEDDGSNYFLVDRRGDAKNVDYAGLHRYSIPSYHRIGYGGVLGADRHLKIDRDASNEKDTVLRTDRGTGDAEDGRRLLSKRNARLDSKSLRLVLPQRTAAVGGVHASAEADMDLDFMSFSNDSKRKREAESSDRDGAGLDYRSIEGKAKAESQPEDEDLEYASDSDDLVQATSSESMARKRNAEFSRVVKADPSNVDGWLSLVQHQARNTFPDLDVSQLSSFQRRTVAELRLSILGQALPQMPAGAPSRDRILLAQINEGSKIWEGAKLSQKWEEVLSQNSYSALIWREYLNYLQSNPTSFRYERCRDAYLKCFRALTVALSKLDAEAENAMSRDIVYILLRYTCFTRDAGYDELAIAVWQAIRDHHLRGPLSNDTPFKLDAQFDFCTNDSIESGADTAIGKVDARNPANALGTPFAAFIVAEARLADTFFLPLAADEDGEDESSDPFRYVMFDDVRPLLESLPGKLDHVLLIDAFLCFTGLPPLLQQDDHAQRWQSDPYLNIKGCTQVRRHDNFSLFYDSCLTVGSGVGNAFVTKYLSVLLGATSDDELLGEYLLAFVNQTAPDKSSKLARRLLKTRPTSLRYYNAYALGEARAGRVDKAEQIWTKASELCQSLEEDSQDEQILLWHSWFMPLTHAGSDDATLQKLLALGDESSTMAPKSNSSTGAGAVLRARRRLEERMDSMRLKSKPQLAVLYADCLAWLLYLTSNHSVEAALQSFKASATKFSGCADESYLEQLHQAKARLIAAHISAKRPFRPILLRNELAESKRLFPENAAVLQQYYNLSKRTRVDDRIRNTMSDATNNGATEPQGLVSWSFAIEAEVDRCSIGEASTTRDSVRALFRRALLAADNGISSSPMLWKRWFDFELAALRHPSHSDSSQRLQAVQRAKQVFFDGLRCLPWNKRWAIEGMAILAESSDVSEEELGQIHDVLLDRELRLRADIEDLKA